jgi:hypothetical protein
MHRGERRRRRILVSAYALSPVLGSEPGVGWNFCSRLAACHDVTVLARSWDEALWPEDARHRKEAERFIKLEGPFPGLTIHFVESPPLSRLLQPHPLVSLRSPFYFQGYAAWQRAAYREAVRLHRAQPFDGTHQLTIGTFREPGHLWRLGVPFFWGPIGGGENIPLSYFAATTASITPSRTLLTLLTGGPNGAAGRPRVERSAYSLAAQLSVRRSPVGVAPQP